MIFALLVTLAKPEEISLDESEPVPGSSRMAGFRKATTCSELALVAGQAPMLALNVQMAIRVTRFRGRGFLLGFYARQRQFLGAAQDFRSSPTLVAIQFCNFSAPAVFC
jgi:hypothetical protein